MEEAKAAAYYDELNRKGDGARRFKQGLGFSSSDSQPASFPSKPTTTTSSSSFLSGFVRAGATPAQLPNPTKPPSPPEPLSRQRRRSLSPSPSQSRPRPRSRSPSRSRRRRSKSRSRSRERRRRSRSTSRERGDRRVSRRWSRSRSRSRSPSHRSGRSSHGEGRRDRHGDRRRNDGDGGRESSKGRGGRDGGKVVYSRLIEGYDRMTPAERVKAEMKLQLSETASKDSTLGAATVGWERFEFNKDAPLDDDDNDVEVANDDASLVKHIGKSFRLSAVESKREDVVRDAHDEAMFGVPTSSILDTETSDDELRTNNEDKKAEDVDAQPSSSLISDKVLAMQKGSWRERAQKLRQDSNT